MPNGGNDNCMLCTFNTNNRIEFDKGLKPKMAVIQKIKGKEKRASAIEALMDWDFRSGHCRIRDFEIELAPYTYCSNHDFRNPDHNPIPLGPAFTGDGHGERLVLHESPDTEEVRLRLLQVLAEITDTPVDEYSAGENSQNVAVVQAGVFREKRAIPELQRIAAYELERVDEGKESKVSYRSASVILARWALLVMDLPPEPIIDKGFSGIVDVHIDPSILA